MAQFSTVAINKFDVIGNLILNLRVESGK